MAETKTILVAGATGQQGGAVARELMKRGHRVLGLTRSTAKFKDLATAGIEGVQGDLTDKTSLAPLLRNADGFFIVTTPFEPNFSVHPEKEVQQGKNAIDAAIAPRPYRRSSDTRSDMPSNRRKMRGSSWATTDFGCSSFSGRKGTTSTSPPWKRHGGIA